MYTLAHPALGSINGVDRGEDIVQFRGIPYADIPGRFRQAIRKSSLPQQPFDAISPGYVCPQRKLPFPEFWTGPLGKDEISITKPEMDELRCLNLNVTTLTTSVKNQTPLPVLFFIHGGGFAGGSSSIQIADREIYDPRNVVRVGAATGKPVVVVTINYRVGPLGFLASRELAAFNRSNGEIVGNYGLHDQRQALLWVAQFISGFGGDPNNITIMGGSAGGASCHLQSLFRDRKFKRAIISSGTAVGIGPLPITHHQAIYDKFAGSFTKGEDSLRSLREVPVDDLVNQHLSGLWNPVIDGDWLKGRTIHECPIEGHPPEYMIGCCEFEDDVMLAMLGSISPPDDDELRGMVRTTVVRSSLTADPSVFLSPDALKHYDAEKALQHPSAHLETCAELLSELIFRIPVYQTCLNPAPGQKVFLYEFQATSPYVGWSLGYGKANHAISDMFFFDAPTEKLLLEKHREEYAGAVRQLREQWLKFCHGQLDWEPMQRLSGDELGPVYTIANYGRGARYESFDKVVGTKLASRWRAMLALCKD